MPPAANSPHLLGAQPAHTLDELVPTVDQRDFDPVHAEIVGSAVVDGGHVADRQLQAVGELIAESEPESYAVDRLTGKAINGGLAAGLIVRVERAPECLGEVAGEVGLELKLGIGLEPAATEVVVVAVEPERRNELEGGPPSGNPGAQLPDDR